MVPKYAFEENLLSSSHRTQVWENKPKPSLFWQIYKEHSSISVWRVHDVKARALIGKEGNPLTWDGDVWKDTIETENFESSESHWIVVMIFYLC